MKFSLVIPCFNEAENLPLLLDRCKALILDKEIEVILVDNGSTDETQEVMKAIYQNIMVADLYMLKKMKVMEMILAGLNSAKGRGLGWTHADMQTDPADALVGLDFFDKHGMIFFVKAEDTEGLY